MSRETSKSVARLAARFLSGELKKLTRKQQLSVCASCVSQAEREQESVKAWGHSKDGKLTQWVSPYRDSYSEGMDADAIRVIITRVRPARADKRTQARKRGK